jgi:hypothetical protein
LTVAVVTLVFFFHRYTPISEDDFFETVFTPVYKDLADSKVLQSTAHQVAVVCLVLAIGTLVDLERHAHAPEAMQYYHYARAAISIESILEEQSVTGIQALVFTLALTAAQRANLILRSC